MSKIRYNVINLTVSIVFVLFCSSVYAQNYIPLPDSNAIWVNTHRYYVLTWPGPLVSYTSLHVDNYCAAGEDTIINAKTYSVLNYCAGQYKGAYRNDQGVTYYVPKDSINEYILYDFSLEAGDTAKSIYYEFSALNIPSFDDFVVHFTDSVLLGGTYRKRIQTDGYMWIEGMGNTAGIFREPWINVSNYQVELHCFSENDNTLYPAFSASSCPLTVSVDRFNSDLHEAKIYPNPSTGFLEIDTSDKLQKEVQVLNTSGNIAIEKTFAGTKTIIDLTSLHNGMYIIVIRSADRVSYKKLMLKK